MSDKRTYQLEERIKRYLHDQMTGQERHAFEREMQHDQFLTEAVEGYSGISAELVGNDLADLKKRNEQTTKKVIGNTSGMWPLRLLSLLFHRLYSSIRKNTASRSFQRIKFNKKQFP